MRRGKYRPSCKSPAFPVNFRCWPVPLKKAPMQKTVRGLQSVIELRRRMVESENARDIALNLVEAMARA